MRGKETSAHPRIIQMAARTGKYKQYRLEGFWTAIAIGLLALLFRAALLSLGKYPFNSDEAIVGLMARHTLNGDWPIFFYGQAYMGSLDASLVAVGFAIFGRHVWVIRLIQLILFIGVLFSSIKLSVKLASSRQAGLVTGLLLAIPTVNLNLYTTVSLGGYGEALLIGNLLILLGLYLVEVRGGLGSFLLWGFLAGLGFWAFGLTVIYTLPVLIMLVTHSLKSSSGRQLLSKAVPVLVGFLLGILPILFWVLERGIGELFAELFGSALAGTSGSGYWQSVLDHILYFILFGISVTLGMRAPWNTDLFFWPLAIIVALFWAAVLTQYIRILRGKEGEARAARLLGGVVLCLVLGFLFTPFGGDPSGRYFLPLGVISAIVAGALFTKESVWIPRWLKWSLLALVIAYQLVGNLQVAIDPAANFTTQFDPVARIDHGYDEELIEFLHEKGELRGYSNYWVAYPIAFKSDEEIIFVPGLPYHHDLRYTPRDNRYAPYDAIVSASDRVAYITTNHSELDHRIRTRFRELDIEWEEHVIGDYQIFYDLSQPVSPEEIDARFAQ